MIFIRKPLSRKFNIVCLKLAGLLACLMLPFLPIHFEQWICREQHPFKRCQIKFGIYLQLREQLQFCTGFPFNPSIKSHERTKIQREINQTV